MSFCSCVFSPFSIAITSLGEERANRSAFRTFVRFALVWFCLFLLPLGVWEGLRFVALPRFFSYLFFYTQIVAEFIAFLCLCVLSDSGTMASENEDRKHNTEKDYEQTVLLEE